MGAIGRSPTLHAGSGASDGAARRPLYCPTCEHSYAAGEHCVDDGTRLVRLTAAADPFLGRTLDGRYTIRERLAQGGMGTVYRGHQHSVGRDVAIKVVNPSLVSSPELIKRFLRECKLTSQLAHPNAVGVLDFGQTDDGTFFLVMELVHGRTLDDVMAREHRLRPARVIRIGMQICDALEGAHAIGIVHRDLKPANVMLHGTGRDLVKVLDFGLAKSLTRDSMSTMTAEGALLGTPAYMPPELANGRPCDGRADLYSLGCVLYYLGTGRTPFVADSVHELVVKHASEPAPPMRGVPPSLAEVVERLLRKEPGERYPSAAAAREALEHALANLRSRRVRKLGAAGTFALVAAAAGVLFAVPGDHAPPLRRDPAAVWAASASTSTSTTTTTTTTTKAPAATTPRIEQVALARPRATPATWIDVRIDAPPGALVLRAGADATVCVAPCKLTIDAADGDSPTRREYVVRLAGFDDRNLAIDLAAPPPVITVRFDPPPAAEPR